MTQKTMIGFGPLPGVGGLPPLNLTPRAPVRTNFTLDTRKLPGYNRLSEGLFLAYGPTKSQITTNAKDMEPPMTAGIAPSTWDVEITYRTGLTFAQNPKLLRYLDQNNIVDPFEELQRAGSLHEMGHWAFTRDTKRGCPFDKRTYYSHFIEPIYEELKASGKFSDDFCKRESERLANAVTDVIDNTNVHLTLLSWPAEKRLSFKGQILFWYLQGQEADQKKYTDLYSLFVRLNLTIIGTGQDNKLLGRFMSGGKDVGQAAKRLRARFTEAVMYDRSKWEMLAREFTKEAIPFLKEEDEKQEGKLQFSPESRACGDGAQQQGGGGPAQQPPPQPAPGSQQPAPGNQQPGQGTPQPPNPSPPALPKLPPLPRPPMQPRPQQQAGAKKPEKKDDRLGNDLSPEDQEIIMGARKPYQGIPFFLKQEEALDAYYRRLARRIQFKTKGDLPRAKYPVIPMSVVPFDPDAHDEMDIILGRLTVNSESGRLVPAVASSHLPIDVPITKSSREMPEFVMALVDASGSMMGRQGPDGWIGGSNKIVPWGDQCGYHYALLAWYGILHFLSSENYLYRVKMSGGWFSNSTAVASGVPQLKKLLLNPPSGGTSLNIQEVMKLMKGKRNALFGLISDGQIDNWTSIRKEFIALAAQNQFFMIEVVTPPFSSSQTSLDLQRAGLAVRQVDSYEKVTKLVIDTTVTSYRGHVTDGLNAEAKKYKSFGDRNK